MRNIESVLENETLKTLWDFEIKTDHLISARGLDLSGKETMVIKNQQKNRDYPDHNTLKNIENTENYGEKAVKTGVK